MSRILFATYEFHPTTWGGCGVLLRHATDQLLERGHEVVLLLDVPSAYFERFVERDHPTLSVPERCRAHHVDALCEDLPFDEGEISSPFVLKSLRFAHAARRLAEIDPVDFVEFFEYCGVGYHAFVEKRFGLQPPAPVLGVRVHNSVELIDLHEGTKPIDRDRSILYGLERAGLAQAEAVLMPSKSYADRYYRRRYALPDPVVEISEPPTARFPRRPERPPAERREIQFFGRIFEFKGVERFVRAGLLLLEERPGLDVDFVLIGNDSRDGPAGTSYTDYLRGTIPERFRDRFVFTGHLDHETVAERFGRGRFAVFPNRFESFCYAMHEAHESGIPLLVADIPAFRNYLAEGRDAHYFDGSSVDLARQMARLLDAPDELERLQTGRRLATQPLGGFYDAPRALRPIPAVAGESDPASALAVTTVVLVPPAATDAQIHRTLDATRSQLGNDDALLLAYHADDERAGAETTAVRWLGETRRFAWPEGRPARLGELRVRDALWLLVAGDQPDPDFVALCRGALARDPALGFAGTWHRAADGRLVESLLDVLPERRPFDAGTAPTRCLIRIDGAPLLVEAFAAQAGAYGEIGALWDAEERFGRGCLLPRPKLVTSDLEITAKDAGQLAHLVQAVASPARRERLALLALEGAAAGVGEGGRPARPPVMDLARAKRIAEDHLDGSTLVRIALDKLRRKLRTRSRSGRGPSVE